MDATDANVRTRFLDFAAPIPWLDQIYRDIDEYVESLGEDFPVGYDLREKLIFWMRNGYAVFPGLVEKTLIDAYVEDVKEVMTDNGGRKTPLLCIEGLGIRSVGDFSHEDMKQPHLRIMDFHNNSVAGKKLCLHREIVRFLGHVFRDRVAMMQSLTFIHGTEQWTHQDFAYVVAENPSYLAATWVALEDVRAEAGPLFYYPGSHSLRKFDWGNGLFLTPESDYNEIDFRDHIEEECGRSGFKREAFLARKGDVFFWHAALAHGGSPVPERGRYTRMALVTHYSSAAAYTFDRRAPQMRPEIDVYNGGQLFRNPLAPADEDCFARGSAF